MSARFVLADVFTNRAFGGNQLVVFPDARGFTDHGMQQLAREFNFPESAFVFPAANGGAPSVRIFTPAQELPFAGHPTIGTAAVLIEDGAAGEGRSAGVFVLHEGIGPVLIEFERRDRVLSVTLVLESIVETQPCELAHAAAALSLPLDALRTARFASVGVPFCLVHCHDRGAVDRATADPVAWARYFGDAWSSAIYFYAGELGDRGNVYARMFAPGFGIPEDPATGSALAALVGLTAVEGDTNPISWNVLQGVAMGRPSQLSASAQRLPNGRAKIRVGGSTVIIGEGILRRTS